MKALVIGGTGPTGPHIVNGLLERGYEVTVLHGGFHEVEFLRPVEHIHTDPHFVETLEAGLKDRSFDVAIATYGRIRYAAEVLKGKTSRLITVSGGVYASRRDPRWGPLPPVVTSEDSPKNDDPNGPRLGHMIWVTEQTVLQAHRDGHYNATVFRYPLIYGPHAPADNDWSIVRRILDGRKQIIIGDGGLRITAKGYAQNAAQGVLLAVDKPEASAGQAYNVRDETLYTFRQRVELIAQALNADLELVSMPGVLAGKVFRGMGNQPEHSIFDITKIQSELGYRDAVPAAEAIPLSVRWLAAHQPERGGESEAQLGDPFDYAAEDELIRLYQEGIERAAQVPFPEAQVGHMYRHPTKPGEAWAPQSARAGS